VNSTDQICDQIIICGQYGCAYRKRACTCTAAIGILEIREVRDYLEDKLVKARCQSILTLQEIGAKGPGCAGLSQEHQKNHSSDRHAPMISVDVGA